MSNAYSLPQIVILGAGFGGLAAAVELDRLAIGGKASVALVDKSDRFSMGFSMQWAFAGRREFGEGERLYAALRLQGARFVQSEIRAINLADSTVELASEVLSYDHLIIALGAALVADSIPGLADAAYNLCDPSSVKELKKALDSISSGTVVVMIASTPFKCPPAPYEYAFLIDDLFRRRGVRSNIRLVVTTPEPQPMPVAGKAVGDYMKQMLAERGIEYFPEWKPKSIDGNTKRIVYENGQEFGFDVLSAMFPHRAPEVLKAAGLVNESGFIPVQLGTFETNAPNVFAVGDCAHVVLPNGKPHPKAGVFAKQQGLVVAQNIAAAIEGTSPAAYPGTGVCFIDVGDEQAAPASISLLAQGGPHAIVYPPSEEGVKQKLEFESEHLAEWFAS